MSPGDAENAAAGAAAAGDGVATAGGAAAGPMHERLDVLARECRGRDVSLGELSALLAGDSAPLLLFVLAVPFCQPVPLFGLSTPVGLLLACLGWQVVCGRSPVVPRRFASIVIPKKFFPALLGGTGRLLRWLESRRRSGEWTALAVSPVTRRLCGANITLCALLLALPVPIPCSNIFPSLPIALGAAAMLERDGRMMLRAGAAAVVNLLFWAVWGVLIGVYGWGAAEAVGDWLKGLW
ncbi:MAG: exopolysaccharide biosynthesis protein [Puniceicoccales bacterium]|jgi:hypothetical protein|nr:exopolysaccharide biosynthesis protein [Puniceicoccales bacterium]